MVDNINIVIYCFKEKKFYKNVFVQNSIKVYVMDYKMK